MRGHNICFKQNSLKLSLIIIITKYSLLAAPLKNTNMVLYCSGTSAVTIGDTTLENLRIGTTEVSIVYVLKMDQLDLTHSYCGTFKWVIGKQCRPRSDATCGI